MAQRIPQEVLEEVRQRTNIVDIVGQYVQLKKSGKNYMGLCPFHEERSPSFSVAEDKQIYHCFGCGKGGTVFNFIQEIEGISFPESVHRVIELENLPISVEWTKTTEPMTVENIHKQKLFELHQKACELYHHVLLNTQVGEPALNYLFERGLTKEMIETFSIGFAPQKRDFLMQVVKNDQLSEEILRDSGLFIQRDNGEFLDRFYQRIVFPIHNDGGKVIAFSGRLLKTTDFSGDELPKYLNSPETLLFNKREVLFNFDRARKDMRKTHTVFLFEGFMDVLAAWQAGITNGVASMGTSLTNEQIRKLERVANELVICYDGDRAGVEATNRAISLLSAHSHFELSVVSIPEKLDPDDYLRKYGQETFRDLFFHGRSTVFSFKMDYHRLNKNMSNEKEQLDYLNELLHELTHIPSPLERDRYLNQLAQEFKLSYQSLEDQLKQIEQQERLKKRNERHRHFEEENHIHTEEFPNSRTEFELHQTQLPHQMIAPLTQVEKAERTLLFRLMTEQSVRNQMRQIEPFSFAHDHYQELYLLLDSYMSEHSHFLLADFLNFLKEDGIRNLAIDISYQTLSDESTEREFTDILKVIGNSSIEEQIVEKQRQKREAERVGNQTLVDELSIELVYLAKQLQKSRETM